MKKLLLSMAVTAGFASSAIAADLPIKARPMAPAPVVATNWTGCYVGAGGGYGMWNQDHRTYDAGTAGFAVAPTPVSVYHTTTGGRGWFGTVQAGCDYQFAPRWVVGVFGDYDFGNQKGNFAPSAVTGPLAFLVGEEKQKWTWAVGGRVGYLIFPGLLGFVSGGYTQTHFDTVALFSQLNPGALSGYTLASQTYSGWFIGTGYEYALDFLPGLFWKTEYRYSAFQSKNVPYSLNGVQINAYEEAKKYTHVVRSELVYRFSWGPGPVMAKY
jgi:outer membrane immunogenic protein